MTYEQYMQENYMVVKILIALERAMKENNMSRKQLSVRTGLALGYICDILDNCEVPRFTVMASLCMSTGVEWKHFCVPGGTQEKNNG